MAVAALVAASSVCPLFPASSKIETTMVRQPSLRTLCILPLFWLLIISSFGQNQARALFFSAVVTGDIEKGMIYLHIPLTAQKGVSDNDRLVQVDTEFFKRAVPFFDKWNGDNQAAIGQEYAENIDARYLDMKYIAASVNQQVGQSLQIRTENGVFPSHLRRFEIHYSETGSWFLIGIAEPDRPGKLVESGRVLAAPKLPDCRRACSLRRIEPTAGDRKSVV